MLDISTKLLNIGQVTYALKGTGGRDPWKIMIVCDKEQELID